MWPARTYLHIPCHMAEAWMYPTPHCGPQFENAQFSILGFPMRQSQSHAFISAVYILPLSHAFWDTPYRCIPYFEAQKAELIQTHENWRRSPFRSWSNAPFMSEITFRLSAKVRILSSTDPASEAVIKYIKHLHSADFRWAKELFCSWRGLMSKWTVPSCGFAVTVIQLFWLVMLIFSISWITCELLTMTKTFSSTLQYGMGV